jgi:hypothetical protein
MKSALSLKASIRGMTGPYFKAQRLHQYRKADDYLCKMDKAAHLIAKMTGFHEDCVNE